MAGGQGTEKRVRTYILPVRLTDEERAALDARALATGCSRAALIRHGLFNIPPPRAVPLPAIEHQAVARLLAELGKIGGNINQLARHAHLGCYREASIELAVRELLALRRACFEALGKKP